MEQAEKALVDALQVLRDARSREQMLRTDLTEALQWKQRYEEAASKQQRLERDLHAAEQQSQALQAQIAASSNARRSINSLRSSSSHVRMRARKMDAETGRVDSFVSARGGLLPLRMSRTASLGNMHQANHSGSGDEAEAGPTGHHQGADPSTHDNGGGGPAGDNGWSGVPVYVNRAPTLDISGLMSMFVTANLLHQDAYAYTSSNSSGPAAPPLDHHHHLTVATPTQHDSDRHPNTSSSPFSGQSARPPVPAPATATSNGEQRLHSASPGLPPYRPHATLPPLPDDSLPPRSGSPMAKLRSWSGSGRTAEGSSVPRTHAAVNFTRHTVDGEGGGVNGLPGTPQAAIPPHFSMSSVSLVDDDGTSGVGLAAAATVAAAAARAWAAAASQQRQQTQQHRNTSSGSQHGGSVHSDLGLMEHSGAPQTAMQQQQQQQGLNGNGRKSGKVGYKLVASVYREPPAAMNTKPSPSSMLPKHASSTNNVPALASSSPHPPPIHHAHTLADLQHARTTSSTSPPAQTPPIPLPAGATSATGSSFNLPAGDTLTAGSATSLGSMLPQVGSMDSGVSDLARRAATAFDAAQQAAGAGLSRASSVGVESVGSGGGGGAATAPAGAVRGAAGAPSGTPPLYPHPSVGAAGGVTAVDQDMSRQVSERRGGWYECGGASSSGDLSELEEMRQASVMGLAVAAVAAAATSPLQHYHARHHHHHAAAPAGEFQVAGPALAVAAVAALADGKTVSVPLPVVTAQPAMVQGPTGARRTATLGAAFSSSLAQADADTTTHVLAAPRAASFPLTLPPHLMPVLEIPGAGQIQGSCRVQEPTTCPGGHLASSTALEAAVRHSVPAVVGGTGLARKSINAVLLREGVHDGGGTLDTPDRAARQLLQGTPQGGVQEPTATAGDGGLQAVAAQRELDGGQGAVETPGRPEQQQGDGHLLPDPTSPGVLAVVSTPALPAPAPGAEGGPARPAGTSPARPASPGRPQAACLQCDKEATKSTALTLHWLSPPRTALVVCKLSPAVYPLLNSVLRWLRARSLSVYVEPETYPNVDPDIIQGDGFQAQGTAPDQRPDQTSDDSTGRGCGGGGGVGGVLTWSQGRCQNHSIPDEVAQDLDFVVVLGGDGTLLWTCHVFGNRAVPPLVPFNMGSLGFLTPFPPSQLDEMLELILAGGFPMILRHRLHATIVRVPQPGKENMGDVCWADGHCATEKVVLNEVVVDRGISPFLTNLECFCDGNFVTHTQGDGLIISTPTGSTAYSLAAGGSMVHPQVPGILFTPVCPHSLSFRPLVFPDHVQLCIQVPHGARSQMYCSFDGKDRQELNAGDAIIIRMSQWPIPTVCSRDPSRDWFTGIREGLHWNERRVQGAPAPAL